MSNLKPVESFEFQKQSAAGVQAVQDSVISELPVELVVEDAGQQHPLVTTLCTPSQLGALVIGFLYSEGLIEQASDVSLHFSEHNAQQIKIVFNKPTEWHNNVRRFVQHSGCGLCSKSVWDQILKQPARAISATQRNALLKPSFIQPLFEQVKGKQPLFEQTGACHGAALFDQQGKCLQVVEDVGRHNAVDKLIGWSLLEGVRLDDKILWVSGRAGFELVQKATNAGMLMMVAVGAPSSLAIELARGVGLLLVGFVKQDGQSYNIYQ